MSSYSLPNVTHVEVSFLRPTSEEAEEGLRICVTGGRDFEDLGLVWSNLDVYTSPLFGPVVEIGFGDAKGVDSLARSWAELNNIPWRQYYADWEKLGRAAGHLRNEVMLDDFKPSLLLVYPGGIGTLNCAKQARKRKIRREFITLDDPFEDGQKWG